MVHNEDLMRPNTFLVGAPKAGTTTVQKHMAGHPEIFMSPIKEPHHFSFDIRFDNFSTKYKKNVRLDLPQYLKGQPLTDRHIAYVENRDHYLSLFKGACNQRVIGEASTGYLFSTEAAKQIYEFCPAAKIIAIIRNPIERAYSHYLMDLRRGFAPSNGFAESVRADFALSDKGWGVSQLYVELGKYGEQLERYYSVFPRSQVKVILFDELAVSTSDVMIDLYRFLGVAPIPINSPEARHNRAKVPKSPTFQRILVNTGIYRNAKSMFPSKLRAAVARLLYSGSSAGNLEDGDYHWLIDKFEVDIAKLENLTGLSLDVWRQRPRLSSTD